MYITRFAHRLDFGEKTKDVIVTATRLVCRMKRDWIHTGRRPSGLCGAALLVSARLHGFNCELDDIKRVVKIGQDTIRKRLTEFQSTPSSQLTINEFMSIDLESEHDPPAYINGRIKAKIQQFEAEAGGMDNVECELGKLSNAIDDDQSTDTEGTSTPKKKYRPPKSQKPLIDAERGESHKDADLQASSEFVHSENPEALAMKIFSPGRNSTAPSEQKNDGHLSQYGGPEPTLTSLGINPTNSVEMDHSGTFKRPYEHLENGELNLDGIDDEEIDRLILSPNESAIKSRIWMKEYGEFLIELEEKREKKRIENEKKDKSRQKGKRNKSRYKDYYSDSKTATEAIEKLVNRQRLSNKINYEALRKATEDVESKAADIGVSSSVVDETNLVKQEYATPQKKKLKLENAACLNPCEDIKPDKIVEERAIPPLHEQEEDAEDEEPEEEHCLSASQLMQSVGFSGGSDDYYGYDEYE